MADLTDTQIKNAKPRAKPHKLFDRDRLYLNVSVAGSKRWYWPYRLGGHDLTYTIGRYPDVSLKAARLAVAQAKLLVSVGQHPQPVKVKPVNKPGSPTQLIAPALSASVPAGASASASAPAAGWENAQAGTLAGVAREWLVKKTPGWGVGHAQKVRALLARYVRDGQLGTRPVSDVLTGDLYELVTTVADRKDRLLVGGERAVEAPHNAIVLRRALDAVFRLAVMKGLIKSNPMADLRASEVIEKPATRHNAKLDDHGLSALLTAVDAYGGQRLTRLAIELLVLTALRTQELRGADWKEIDFKASTWTIPASRMKRRIAHTIPLSVQALAVLEKLKVLTGGVGASASGWIFQNSRRPHDFMASTTINAALAAMGFGGQSGTWFRAHGCRGTFSTWAYGKGYRTEAIEQQLAHLEPDETKRAYLLAEFWPERRQIMDAWACYLDGLRSGVGVGVGVGDAAGA